MRLTIHKDQGIWSVTDLDETHLELLRQASDDASMTDCPEGRSRLFPSPVDKKDARKERTFIDDWKEYVTDDLENHFAGDVGTLLADLDNVERLEPDKNGAIKAQLEVPIEHAQAWFSALNQARLMLDKKFLLFPLGEEDFRPVLEEEEAQGIDLQERLQVYMRYEFFSAVQEWLVKHAF